jgi:hypothetical protein
MASLREVADMSILDDKIEEIIEQKVQRAIAPWRDVVSPQITQKLAKIAEDYYRHHPAAVPVIRALAQRGAVQRSAEFSTEEMHAAVSLAEKKGAQPA